MVTLTTSYNLIHCSDNLMHYEFVNIFVIIKANEWIYLNKIYYDMDTIYNNSSHLKKNKLSKW